MTPEHQQAEREALKPCPFCGNEAEFKPYKRDGLTLKCMTLGCVQFNQRTMRYSLDWLRGKMIEGWNRRAGERADVVPLSEEQINRAWWSRGTEPDGSNLAYGCTWSGWMRAVRWTEEQHGIAASQDAGVVAAQISANVSDKSPCVSSVSDKDSAKGGKP